MTAYTELENNLEALKLNAIKEYLPNYLEGDKQLSLAEILKQLTDKELNYRKHRSARMSIHTAHFPYQKEIKDFDFNFQPSVDKGKITNLMSMEFVENARNVLFIGSSGVGKTHLATGLGVEACKNHLSTYFVNCHELIERLKLAYQENRLEPMLKNYLRYKLLIIDEIGYLPIDDLGSNLFFQLISRRYEKKSIIVTTNIPLSKWGQTFSNPTIANAILDRLVHHSEIFKISGKSYRMKDYTEQHAKQHLKPVKKYIFKPVISDNFKSVLTPNLNYLPETLCIDEFKSMRSAKGKMSFIAVDGDRSYLFELLEDRRLRSLFSHYQQFTQHARRRVKYLVMDMNAAYDQLVKTVFPCAQIIYDRFHIAKHLNDTMNHVRTHVFNRLRKGDSQAQKQARRLKHYWRLFLQDRERLSTK